MSDKEIKDMINEIDYQGNGKINYSEFLAATIDVKQFLTDHRLRAIFQQFDTDNTGKLTPENIKFAFQKLGHSFTMEDVTQMVKSHDKLGDGVLNFEEFKEVFFEQADVLAKLDNGLYQPFGSEGPK
jgi:Ca2+-binding EF-hand superfamily protein